ncbi:TPA: hypothetical protein ACPVZG_000537 [Vibrio parahaemolyticus]
MSKKAIKLFLIGKLTLTGAGIIHEKHDPHIHNEHRTTRLRDNGAIIA